MAQRLTQDVEALAAIERRSASPGERRSAEWLAGRLAEAGAQDVELRTFNYQRTFAHAHAAHFGAGLAGAAIGGLTGRAISAATFVSFEREYSGRSQWLRHHLPADEGVNVVGRVPAAAKRRRRLVLVAHHDAAQTGLMWHPALVGAARGSFAAPAELALLAAAALGWRRLPAVVLAAALGLSLEVARGATVPGASDNATGVAAVLALVERLVAESLTHTEVVVVLPGCEESGMGGMAGWLAAERERLDPRNTLVLGLDTLGAGEPVVLEAEGPLRRVRYEHVAIADRAADAAGLPRPRRFRAGGWTDPVLAELAGLPALSLLSAKGRGFTNYHLPSDTPENVDWGSVKRCFALADAVARYWG